LKEKQQLAETPEKVDKTRDEDTANPVEMITAPTEVRPIAGDGGVLQAEEPPAPVPAIRNSQSPSPAQPITVPTESAASAESTESRADTASVMTVVEHLDELRARLIRCIIYIFGAFVAALFITKDIIVLLEKPAAAIQFQALSLEEPLVVFIKVAFYTGIALASPLVLLEISRFVSPGLTRKEKQIMMPIVVGSPALFLCGAAFAYYGLLPPMLRFFGSFGQGVTPINQRLDFYISLVSSLLLYMGLCFQLPIIIFALSFTGLVTSRHLVAIWRYALAGITLVAAVVTPDPTAFSMILVMAALSALYFLSIILLKIFGR
jgi:sec-independent protein translocase protein TatC